MKVSILIISVLLLNSCNKSHENDSWIRAQLVVSSCEVQVVQILNSHYYYLTQDTWTSLSGKSYSHIFRIANFCSFGALIDKEFYFQIATQVQPNRCPVCHSFEIAPQVSQNINFVKYIQ